MPWKHQPGISIDTPSCEDLAYLAGLLDGEGCFYAYDRSGQGMKIAMQSRESIEWCRFAFSGSKHTTIVKSTGKTVWVWQLQRKSDLLYLLPLLIPYLKAKKKEAQALLEYIEFSCANPARTKTAWAEFRAQKQKLRAALVSSRKE